MRERLGFKVLQPVGMEIEVLTRAELVRRCGSPDKARQQVRLGVWRRVVRNAYVDGVWGDSPEVRLAVLRKLLPEDVAVSHRTALWLLGRDVLGDKLDVTVGRGRHLASWPGVRMHIAALPDVEVVELDGLLRTSVARSVVDVARSESLVEAVAFGDEALRSGAATADLIAASLDVAHGLRGVVAARRVLPLLNGRSESPMESRLRMGFVLGGVEGLDVQYDVYDDDGHAGRSDMHLDGVLVEYDGREERLNKPVFTAERRRQNRLADTTLQLRRFTAPDYYRSTPAQLAAVLRRAVAAANGRDRLRVRSGPDTLRPPALMPLPTRAELSARRAA